VEYNAEMAQADLQKGDLILALKPSDDETAPIHEVFTYAGLHDYLAQNENRAFTVIVRRPGES